jgi:hypothetical protein
MVDVGKVKLVNFILIYHWSFNVFKSDRRCIFVYAIWYYRLENWNRKKKYSVCRKTGKVKKRKLQEYNEKINFPNNIALWSVS